MIITVKATGASEQLRPLVLGTIMQQNLLLSLKFWNDLSYEIALIYNTSNNDRFNVWYRPQNAPNATNSSKTFRKFFVIWRPLTLLLSAAHNHTQKEQDGDWRAL